MCICIVFVSEFVFVFVFVFEFVHLSSNNLDNQASPFQGWTPGARIGRARPRWQRGQRAGRSRSDQNYQRAGLVWIRSWLSVKFINKKKHIFGMVDISDIFQKVKTKKRASGKRRFEKRRLSLNLRWEWKWWTPIICAKLRMLWLYSVFSKSCRFDAQESKWQICWMMMTRVRQQ